MLQNSSSVWTPTAPLGPDSWPTVFRPPEVGRGHRGYSNSPHGDVPLPLHRRKFRVDFVEFHTGRTYVSRTGPAQVETAVFWHQALAQVITILGHSRRGQPHPKTGSCDCSEALGPIQRCRHPNIRQQPDSRIDQPPPGPPRNGWVQHSASRLLSGLRQFVNN